MRFIITAQAASSEAATSEAATGEAGTGEANQGTEASLDLKLFAEYMKFNEEMHKAGVLVASEGLNPAAPGARVAVARGKRHIVDGPFTESKELVGGFYIIDVKSLDEAIQWALRAPSGMGTDDVLEIRQLTGAGDIPPELLEIIQSVAPTWSASVWQARE